jgi:hypothetical protein
MTAQQYYVPILKARAGEIAALGEISADVRSGLTPLLELTPPPTQRKNPLTPSQHIAEVFEALALTWIDPSARIGVDIGLLGNAEVLDNGQRPWGRVEDVLEPLGLDAVPVVTLEKDVAVGAESLAQTRGVMIRLRSDDLAAAYTSGGQEKLAGARDAMLRQLGVDVAQVDLVLDRGDLNAVQPGVMSSRGLAPLLDWAESTSYRSIMLAGTSAPSDLADAVGFGELRVERAEWSAWTDVATDHPRVSYGDYSGLAPALPAGFGRTKHPYLRYLLDHELLILRHEAGEGMGLSEFTSLCKDLVRRDEFAGDEHCAGCARVAAVVGGDATPSGGGATAWRTISVAHHLTTASGQLSSRRGA